jgi:metallo-beta-lactamase family protein
LVKRGYKGPIWATPATVDLTSHLLRDSARIQMGDAEYLNKKFADDPEFVPIQPIYDEDDADRAIQRFKGAPYDQPFAPLPGVRATFVEAGHILGSAQVVLEVGGKRLVFSGDLGRRGLSILRDPADPGPADFVFMESTYGNRVHAPVGQMHDDLERVVTEAVRKKGKVIIPAFSVGRTQEIVYTLHQLYAAGRIPELPMFVDSPLGTNATEVFRRHPECYDEEIRAFVELEGDPFSFKALRYVESKEESIRLNGLAGPAIIIASSGMCEAGRILHHLKNNVGDERNTVLIVGFQAQHTLGRRLVEKRPRVKILGVERDVFAKVVVLNAFSAHGDKNDLFDWARGRTGAKRVFLIHGEPEQQQPLAEELGKTGLQVSMPKVGDTIPLE